VVHMPSVEAEDQRHLHRALETLKWERARTTTHLKGVRSRQGVRLTTVSKLPKQLAAFGCGMANLSRGAYADVYFKCMRTTGV
jgi:hypothetical protein